MKKVTLDVSIFQNSKNFDEKHPHWKIREQRNNMKLKLLSLFILVNAKSNVQVLFGRDHRVMDIILAVHNISDHLIWGF